MSRVAVIGIGSPFGADRLGWEVIERLQTDDETVTFECWDEPLTGLVERFRNLDAAILVDASCSGEPVGVCRVLEPGQLAGQGLCWSSHGIGLDDVIALGRTLDALPTRLIIVAAEIGDSNRDIPPESAIQNAMMAVDSARQSLLQELLIT